jgi:hypothetical protein
MVIGIVMIVIGLKPTPPFTSTPASPESNKPVASTGSEQRPAAKQLTIYPQISSGADSVKFETLKAALPPNKYLVQPLDPNYQLVQQNLVHYCNSANKPDADDLAALIESKGFHKPSVTQTAGCKSSKTLNVLEVWLQPGG